MSNTKSFFLSCFLGSANIEKNWHVRKYNVWLAWQCQTPPKQTEATLPRKCNEHRNHSVVVFVATARKARRVHPEDSKWKTWSWWSRCWTCPFWLLESRPQISRTFQAKVPTYACPDHTLRPLPSPLVPQDATVACGRFLDSFFASFCRTSCFWFFCGSREADCEQCNRKYLSWCRSPTPSRGQGRTPQVSCLLSFLKAVFSTRFEFQNANVRGRDLPKCYKRKWKEKDAKTLDLTFAPPPQIRVASFCWSSKDVPQAWHRMRLHCQKATVVQTIQPFLEPDNVILRRLLGRRTFYDAQLFVEIEQVVEVDCCRFFFLLGWKREGNRSHARENAGVLSHESTPINNKRKAKRQFDHETTATNLSSQEASRYRGPSPGHWKKPFAFCPLSFLLKDKKSTLRNTSGVKQRKVNSLETIVHLSWVSSSSAQDLGPGPLQMVWILSSLSSFPLKTQERSTRSPLTRGSFCFHE